MLCFSFGSKDMFTHFLPYWYNSFILWAYLTCDGREHFTVMYFIVVINVYVFCYVTNYLLSLCFVVKPAPCAC